MKQKKLRLQLINLLTDDTVIKTIRVSYGTPGLHSDIHAIGHDTILIEYTCPQTEY